MPIPTTTLFNVQWLVASWFNDNYQWLQISTDRSVKGESGTVYKVVFD